MSQTADELLEANRRLTERNEELAQVLEQLADFHHRSLEPSRLHKPRDVLSFHDCEALTCRDAHAALMHEPAAVNWRQRAVEAEGALKLIRTVALELDGSVPSELHDAIRYPENVAAERKAKRQAA